MRLIDADKLLQEFNNKGIRIEFDLPVEEILGEDFDLDDFASLMQDGIMVYKKMVIDTIKNQPTAYNIDKVVEQLEEISNDYVRYNPPMNDYENGYEVGVEAMVDRAIDIVKAGGKNDE